MKKIICLFVLITCVCSIVGCGTNTNDNGRGELEATLAASYDDVSTWSYNSNNSRFIAIDKSHIIDETTNGIDFITYVDVETSILWVFSEKYQRGYGTTFSPIVDSDGKYVLYDGDIEKLKENINIY